MTLRRILANLLSGLVLVAILVGLVFIIIAERCERNVRDNEASNVTIIQEVR